MTFYKVDFNLNLSKHLWLKKYWLYGGKISWFWNFWISLFFIHGSASL